MMTDLRLTRDRSMRPRSAREGGNLYFDLQASTDELAAAVGDVVGDGRSIAQACREPR